MARARNIKPAFFDNDTLALNNDPLGRLLFIGLWTLADYNGNLEWRAHRIKVKLLPYDDCDVEKLAINLDKSGFVRFYSDGEKILLNIPNFTLHQNPHKNERDKGPAVVEFSEERRQLIDLKGLTINPDKSGEKPEDSGSNPADSCFLNPDSPSLNPETGIPNGEDPPPADADEPRDPPGEDDKNSGEKEIPKLAIDHLNQICGTRYQKTAKNLGFINARVSEGASLDEVKMVIEFKHREWSDDPKMAQYLRPETLFGPSKFPGYLAAAKAKRVDRDPGHVQPGYKPDLSRAMDTSRGFFDD